VGLDGTTTTTTTTTTEKGFSWGGGWTSQYHSTRHSGALSELTPLLETEGERKKKKGALAACQAGLSSYLYMLLTMRVNPHEPGWYPDHQSRLDGRRFYLSTIPRAIDEDKVRRFLSIALLAADHWRDPAAGTARHLNLTAAAMAQECVMPCPAKAYHMVVAI
jgi:hypothetical protein